MFLFAIFLCLLYYSYYEWGDIMNDIEILREKYTLLQNKIKLLKLSQIVSGMSLSLGWSCGGANLLTYLLVHDSPISLEQTGALVLIGGVGSIVFYKTNKKFDEYTLKSKEIQGKILKLSQK